MFDERVKTIGLFTATYDIGTGLLGAPNFRIEVTVNTVDKTLKGTGTITQSLLPFQEVHTRLRGHYMPLLILPAGPMQTYVVATGSSVFPWWTNVHLFMTLDTNWKSGSASYRYRKANGQWAEVTNVPVKRVD